MMIYPLKIAQMAALQQNEALAKILPKYDDYADVFFSNLAMELLKSKGINKHAIKLEDDKQSPYISIYSLRLVELETLKTYIKIYSKTKFIQFFKSPANIPILFDKKLDSSFCLCFNYWGLNNLTI